MAWIRHMDLLNNKCLQMFCWTWTATYPIRWNNTCRFSRCPCQGQIQMPTVPRDVYLERIRQVLAANIPFGMLHCSWCCWVFLRDGRRSKERLKHEHFPDSQNNRCGIADITGPRSSASAAPSAAGWQYLQGTTQSACVYAVCNSHCQAPLGVHLPRLLYSRPFS